MRKKNIEKEKKEAKEYRILEKTVYFGGRRPYLRKNKVYFNEGRKRSQRGDSIFGTILSTALPFLEKL